MAEPEPLYPRPQEARTTEPKREEPSIGDTVRELIADVGDLIRGEFELARREIRSDAAAVGRGVAFVAVGGLVAFLGVIYLLLAAVLALSTALAPWLAAVIVGGVVLVIGAILAAVGMSRLKTVNPLPEQTMETVQEDAEWLRNRMR